MYCLWLDRKRVENLTQLRENFHLQSLCGYLLGGSLGAWLEAAGEPQFAEKVKSIDLEGDYEKALTDLFGRKEVLPPFEADFGGGFVPFARAGSFAPGSSFASSFGSFTAGSFYTGSFSANNNNNNNGGSYSLGSFFFQTGSYSLGSFYTAVSSGSFFAGSYSLGSFAGGSFALPTGSFAPGSFSSDAYSRLSPMEKIAVNISSEPLNRFGYGIHLV